MFKNLKKCKYFDVKKNWYKNANSLVVVKIVVKNCCKNKLQNYGKVHFVDNF